MQTAQFADSGNAEAAFVSLTIASSPHFHETGTFIPLSRRYPAIRQCGITLKSAANRPASETFLQWLTSAAVQHRLPQFGLDPVQ